jgi:hypothetical protein
MRGSDSASGTTRILQSPLSRLMHGLNNAADIAKGSREVLGPQCAAAVATLSVDFLCAKLRHLPDIASAFHVSASPRSLVLVRA